MNISREEIYESLASRHGRELQVRFEKACVAVCGLGGLGSNIAIMLARAGIGKLILIDFDQVELSNVNRQQYFLRQIGMNKTAACKEILGDINPYTQVVTHNLYLNESNVADVVSEATIVCEAFDNAENKAMLVNTVLEKMPQKYVVAASGMAGLDSANRIVTKKITSHFYLCGDGEADVATSGSLLSSRVTVCAAHQANAILYLIAEKDPV